MVNEFPVICTLSKGTTTLTNGKMCSDDLNGYLELSLCSSTSTLLNRKCYRCRKRSCRSWTKVLPFSSSTDPYCCWCYNSFLYTGCIFTWMSTYQVFTFLIYCRLVLVLLVIIMQNISILKNRKHFINSARHFMLIVCHVVVLQKLVQW